MLHKGKLISEEIVGICFYCKIGTVTLKTYQNKKLRKRRNRLGQPTKDTPVRRKECRCQNLNCGKWFNQKLFSKI